MMNINDRKIRTAFKEHRDGTAASNTQTRSFAYWGLTDMANGGPFYLLGNSRTMELWHSERFSSRKSDSKLLIRVRNDPNGYAELAEVLEQQAP